MYRYPTPLIDRILQLLWNVPCTKQQKPLIFQEIVFFIHGHIVIQQMHYCLPTMTLYSDVRPWLQTTPRFCLFLPGHNYQLHSDRPHWSENKNNLSIIIIIHSVIKLGILPITLDWQLKVQSKWRSKKNERKIRIVYNNVTVVCFHTPNIGCQLGEYQGYNKYVMTTRNVCCEYLQ